MLNDDMSIQEAIDKLLALFNDDEQAAITAIKKHSLTKTSESKRSVSDRPVILEARNLEKYYKLGKTKVEALNGVSLEIHEGEFVAITGESGSGKSTLLQMMGGLDKPSDGVVRIDGVNLQKLKDGELSTFRGQTIGFVFQSFYLQPFLNLSRNIEVVGMFARLPRKDRVARVAELAEKVGLSNRLTHFPKELSGGQIQRAAIARALLNNPKIILADEPTGNLDSANSQSIIDLFESIRRDFDTAIVLVTHDQALARRADRIIRLQDGRVLDD